MAVKVLRHEYSKDKVLAERFIREARAASRIGHPNIVDVTDFGKLPNGGIYFVMELLTGRTLQHELRRSGPLNAERTVDLATQICQGLAAAHAMGIIHRDLKPENIFILNPRTTEGAEGFGKDRIDFVKLLDFGHR